MRNKKFLNMTMTMLVVAMAGVACASPAGAKQEMMGPALTLAPMFEEDDEFDEPEATETPEATPTEAPQETLAPTPTTAPTATLTPTEAPQETLAPTATATPMPTAEPTPAPTEGPAVTEIHQTMYATTNVFIRSLPSTDAGSVKLDKLLKGNSITVTGQCEGTPWYRVDYKGQVAYVHGNYLTTEQPATPTPTPIPAVSPRPVIEITPTPIPTAIPTPLPGSVVSELNIRMVGDNLIHKVLYNRAKQENGNYDFSYIFQYVKDEIKEADLAIINQETIFVADNSLVSAYPQFGTPDEMGKSIVEAGFDIVAHATNHTLDKGLTGVQDTIKYWESNYPEITYLGIHDSKEESDIAYVEKDGFKLAFVNYTYGLNGLDDLMEGNTYVVDMLSDKKIENTLKEAEANSDMVIAILHVGDEYVYEPSSYARKQVDRFIDGGADIILCAHPHVVEPYGYVKTDKGNTALVYYSLGNFVSGQNQLPRVIGGMADITLRKTEYNGEVTFEVGAYTMVPLVTHQQGSTYLTYKLEDYTDELCKKHRLYEDGAFDVDYLTSFYYSKVNSMKYIDHR